VDATAATGDDIKNGARYQTGQPEHGKPGDILHDITTHLGMLQSFIDEIWREKTIVNAILLQVKGGGVM
jgi:hypothetical protein